MYSTCVGVSASAGGHHEMVSQAACGPRAVICPLLP